jgi:pimeloyl-ACP methyl ester carboxylesterase
MKLHSQLIGSGEPVVLLHGILASSHYWKGVIDTIDTTTHQVLAIDMLGFGQSPKPAVGYDIENYADLIMQTIQDSGIETPVTLVGHSMGSLVAAYIAQHHPSKIKNLVLVSPPFYASREQALDYIVGQSTYAKLFRTNVLARISCWAMCHARAPLRVLTRLFYRGVPKQVAYDVLQHNWHSYSGVLENIIINQDYLQSPQPLIKITILYGSEDRLIVHRNLLNFSDSTKIIKVDTGHNIPLDDTASVIEAIKLGDNIHTS